jgi:hypothetical protein
MSASFSLAPEVALALLDVMTLAPGVMILVLLVRRLKRRAHSRQLR